MSNHDNIPLPKDGYVTFYSVAVTVLYERGNKARQRTMNLLHEGGQMILARDLNQIVSSAIGRMATQHKVDASSIIDVVITNIVMLAYCTSEQFFQDVADPIGNVAPEITSEDDGA